MSNTVSTIKYDEWSKDRVFFSEKQRRFELIWPSWGRRKICKPAVAKPPARSHIKRIHDQSHTSGLSKFEDNLLYQLYHLSKANHYNHYHIKVSNMG
jgi:hypothetical protein